MKTMKALTVHQPWSWLIANRYKPLENRSWPPPKSLHGERFAIHSSKKFPVVSEETVREIISAGTGGPKAFAEANRWAASYPTKREDFTLGAIVCTVILEGVITEPTGNPLIDRWYEGQFGWLLKDVRVFEPIACRGSQKLWNVSHETFKQIEAA